jgi:hypothetical protein
MRQLQVEFMKDRLYRLQDDLTADSTVALSPVFLEAHGVHSVTSGSVLGYEFREPAEVDRRIKSALEPDLD